MLINIGNSGKFNYNLIGVILERIYDNEKAYTRIVFSNKNLDEEISSQPLYGRKN